MPRKGGAVDGFAALVEGNDGRFVRNQRRDRGGFIRHAPGGVTRPAFRNFMNLKAAKTELAANIVEALPVAFGKLPFRPLEDFAPVSLLVTTPLVVAVNPAFPPKTMDELVRLIEGANELLPGSVVADLRIARGLDYYTGSVFESTMIGHEDLGSVCSGGRYDSLVSDGKRTYPGVGLSIGVSRIISRLLAKGLVSPSRKVPTCVLVAVSSEEERRHAEQTAMALRRRGIPSDVSPGSQKFGKQIRFADRRGIPFVWFTTEEGEQVKDIRSGEQVAADSALWEPPAQDLHPGLIEGP